MRRAKLGGDPLSHEGADALTVMAVLGGPVWAVARDRGRRDRAAPAAAAIPVIAERGAARPALRADPAPGDRHARAGAPRGPLGPRPQLPAGAPARRRGDPRCWGDDEDADLRDLAGSLFGEGVPATTTRATGACAWSRAPGPATRCSRRWSSPTSSRTRSRTSGSLPQSQATDDRSLARAAPARGHGHGAHDRLHPGALQRRGGARRPARLGVRGHRRPAAVHGGAGAVPVRGRGAVRRPPAETPAGAGTWSTPPTSRARRRRPSRSCIRGAYLRADEPQPVRLRARAVLGDGWRRAAAGTWGELQTRAARLGARRGRLGRRPLRAVAIGRGPALIMRWRWDTPRDVAEFEQRLRAMDLGVVARRGGS